MAAYVGTLVNLGFGGGEGLAHFTGDAARVLTAFFRQAACQGLHAFCPRRN
jgi:hypothetical protein